MNRWALNAFALVALLPAGCVPVLVGAGAAAVVGAVLYVNGEAKREYSAGINRTWNASIAACRQTGLIDIRGVGPDAWKGSLHAVRPSDGVKVTIHLEALGEHRTLVKIRFGLTGDKSASEFLHGKIASNLR